MSFGNINCKNCGQTNSVIKLVSSNVIRVICQFCFHENLSFSLKKLRKKVIYLDQNFFSEMYKIDKNGGAKTVRAEFEKRSNKLIELAEKQLIICPYSEMHDQETVLFDGHNEALWKYIKRISRGKSFKLIQQIEKQQLLNSYVSFMNDWPDNYKGYEWEAYDSSIHEWDDTLIIDNDFRVTSMMKSGRIKNSQLDFTKRLMNVLPAWKSSSLTVKQNYEIEIRQYAYRLAKNFLHTTFMAQTTEEEIHSIFNNVEYNMICSLFNLKISGNAFEEKFNNVLRFLKSMHFRKTPYIDISSWLWAILKDDISKKNFLNKENEEKIEKEARGVGNDISFLSTFSPYCDAVFIEKRMARYLKSLSKHTSVSYKFKIFSVSKWDEFDAYLESLEEGLTDEMKVDLEVAYGE